jgi:hypothetical protein
VTNSSNTLSRDWLLHTRPKKRETLKRSWKARKRCLAKGRMKNPSYPWTQKCKPSFLPMETTLTIGCFRSDSVKQEKRDGWSSSPNKTKQLRSCFFTAAHQIGISPDGVLFCSNSSKKRETTYYLQMLLLHLHEVFASLHFWKLLQNGGLSLFVLLNSLLF